MKMYVGYLLIIQFNLSGIISKKYIKAMHKEMRISCWTKKN